MYIQERINSFLLYLYHVGSIRENMCGHELEFTLKRILKQNLCISRNNILYPNGNTKKYILGL